MFDWFFHGYNHNNLYQPCYSLKCKQSLLDIAILLMSRFLGSQGKYFEIERLCSLIPLVEATMNIVKKDL